MSSVYCQDAYNAGSKPEDAYEAGLIAGCVFSPRYRVPDAPWDVVGRLSGGHGAVFDPETYLENVPADRLGRLPDWPYWAGLQGALHRSRVRAYREAVPTMLSHQTDLGFRTVTASGPLMPALYGYEQDVLFEVASEAQEWAAHCAPAGGVLLGVPITASALSLQPTASEQPHEDIDRWLDVMTTLQNPGFYFVVDWVSAPYAMPTDPVVLSNLMYLTHSLAELNGRRVIFGYCGLWGVLMAAAGADAIASGWYLSTRRFASERFRLTGGRASHRRVWVRDLLSEMTEPELTAVCKGRTPPDGASETLLAAYAGLEVPHTGSQLGETTHNWRAMGDILSRLGQPSAEERTKACLAMVEAAEAFHQQHCAQTDVATRTIAHLAKWRAAIQRFRKMVQWDRD